MPQVGRHFTLALELIKSAANERAVHKGHRKAKEPKEGRREKWVGDAGFKDKKKLIVGRERGGKEHTHGTVTLSALSDLRGTACLI